MGLRRTDRPCFAQLWRNTDNRDDPPTFWPGFRPPAEWACQIVVAIAIATVTGADQATVERAIDDSPYVRVRPDHLDPLND